MRIGIAVILAVAFAVTGAYVRKAPGQSGPEQVDQASPHGDSVVFSAAMGSQAAEGQTASGSGSTYDYVGSNKCKKCHLTQHKSWAKTEMGKALETLKPGNAVEAKAKYGLDPTKDYSTDESCLPCHTTGYGKKGGYAIPDPEDKKAVRKAKKLAGVGCESCHGPGSAYIKIFEEIYKSKRKYKVDELYAAGLQKVEKSGCKKCHNDKGPTFDSAHPFDFEKMKTEDLHEHKPLEQREE